MKKKLLSMILVISVLFGNVLPLPLEVFAEGAEVTETVLKKSTQGNPIIGFDENNEFIYVGNPSILVDGDTVYLYVGHDAQSGGGGYNMPNYLLYSTKDMVNWTYHGEIMNMRDVSWSDDSSAWAAQVIKYQGKYYLLYCAERNWTNGGSKAVGVAVSDAATGPFVDKGILINPDQTNTGTYVLEDGQTVKDKYNQNKHANGESFGWEDINPTAWIETAEYSKDGKDHVYMGWGNTYPWMCELEIDGDSVKVKDQDGDGQITQGIGKDLWYQDISGIPSIASNGNTNDMVTFTEATYKVLDDGTLEITRYNGTAANLTIPETIDGKLVTRIGAWSFWGCGNLRTVRLPDSITNIGDYAFDMCRRLTSINIPSQVTEIGFAAISDCDSLTSIDIPSSVTKIDGSAFSGCSSLKSVAIPSSVAKLEENIFENCSGLESVVLPDSLTSIGQGAFSGCSSLKNINIPSSVTELEERAFYNCSSLKSISLPDSLKSMGQSAFSGCSSLEGIAIPIRISSIGMFTFFGCSSLKSIHIPKTMIEIGTLAFDGCSSLQDVYYGDSESQWEQIRIDSSNESLLGADIHYTEEKPEPDVKPTGIFLSKTTLSLKKGSSEKLTYTLTPLNTSAAVTFTSSSPEVAAVDRISGIVTAKREGTAAITAETSGLTATCWVTVTEEQKLDTPSPAVKPDTPSPAVKLKTPSLTVKLNSANGVKLSWKKVSGAEGYYVYRAISKNGSYKKIKQVKGTSYVNNKLKSGKTYYYKVAAYAGSTLSAKSKAKSKKIIGKPGALNVKCTINRDKQIFTISWNNVKRATHIEILCKNASGRYETWKTLPVKDKKASYAFNGNYKIIMKLRAYYIQDGKKIDGKMSKELKI